MQTVRGKAYNTARYKQVIDYSGLLYERGITPTDIDGALDFGGKFFVFLEFKSGQAPIPGGQRLALERICDGLALRFIVAVIVGRHNTDPDEEIDAAGCAVSEFRWRGKWMLPRHPITVRGAIDTLKKIGEAAPMAGGNLIRLEFMEPPDIRPREQMPLL